MRLKLETLLSAVGVVTAIAYVLGWLQAFYYFDSFGIRLASVEMSTQDYLLNSWFVLENVVFFVILLWIVVKTPRWWSLLIGGVYFLIPIGAHYAFFFPDSMVANFLIEYRHTLLKFIPFVMLAAVMLFDWRRGTRAVGAAIDLSWPYERAMFALFVIIVAAWSVSVAKHFGSFDANLELRYPDRMLARVQLRQAAEIVDLQGVSPAPVLYLIHATPTQLFIWNSTGFTFGKPDQRVTVHVIARDQVKWFDTTKTFVIQRGSFIF